MPVGFLLLVLSLFFRCLPRRVADGFGVALGWMWYYLVPVRRAVARANLRAALDDLSSTELRRLVRATFIQTSRCAVEFLRLPGLDRRRSEALVEHEGLEHLERARALGRGVIVATAHFGNFDLMAGVEALRGVPLHVVTRTQHVASINRFWMRVRAQTGLRFVPDRNAAFRIRRLLRDNQVVALAIDQHMPPSRGIPVPFFGRPASTTHAPALLSLTTGAPILPVSIERLPAGRHRVLIEPPLETAATGNRNEDVLQMTLALNRWLEGRIRARPDHWLWIHRRWKLPA